VLVTSQVALSLVLLAGAGLFARSIAHLGAADPGFRGDGVLLASVDLFAAGYDADRGRTVVSQALERLRALPGVTDVTVARRVPLALGGTSSTTIRVEGYEPPPSQPAFGHFNQVGPDYFRTLGARLVEGRDLLASDTADAPPVAVVNETMARRYWPDGRALGGRFRTGSDWITVVGIVRDLKLRSIAERPLAQFYLPVLQRFRPDLTFHVRAEGDLHPLASSVRQALREVDPALAPSGVRTLAGVVRGSAFQQRAAGQVLALFGALGLALAAVGLYGVLAYAVAQRTREIGVRMALGGSRRAIFSLVFRQGMRLALAGIAVGVAGGLALTRPMAALLVGVRPTDPLTFAAVALVLAVVAGCACAAPSWRAMRLEPTRALREE
jgi:predicted permease